MRRSASIAAIVLGLCIAAGTRAQDRAALAQDSGPFGQPGTMKVRVPSETARPNMGRLVADYGSFVILEVDARALPAAADVEPLPNENRILLNAGPLDTTLAAVKQLRQPRVAFQGRALHMVQFAGPIKREWYAALVNSGVEIVTYIPSNAYLVYGDAPALAALQAMAAADTHVQWDGEYLPEYRIDPRAAAMMNDPAKANAKDLMFSIQLVKDDATNKATLGVIDAARTRPVQQEWEILNYHNIIVPIPPSLLGMIAALPEVVSIQPWTMPTKLDERQDQIIAGNLSGGVPTGPGYLTWLATQGFTQAQFTASNFVVDVSDSGVDNGTTNPNHFGLFTGGLFGAGNSRLVYIRLLGTAHSGSTLAGCDGHGNLNSHVIAGYNNTAGSPFADASGYHYGLGVCPFVKVGSSVVFDPNTFTSPSYSSLQSQAYASGARISSNSWGGTSNGYSIDSQSYDTLVRDAQSGTAGNQEMVIVFAAGNAGSGANTVGEPSTAKNVITVGAGEGVQAFGGSDGCATTDAQASSANDMATFSSRGPTSDGRKKPDIVAPGTHISGGVAQASQVATGTGTKLACYTGTGVCGGVSSIYFPSAGQQFYTASSGTSHSTPCVAGGCALVRQYFINQGMTAPSPAMTKAVLMNSARFMTGTGAGTALWSNAQGMGEMNLGETFKYGTTTQTIFRDELAADVLTATGQTRVFTGTIADSAKPFRVTVVWSDAPGATSGAAYKNNLDLTVTVGANTYKGNVFTTSASATGGTADAANNAESVFLPAGTSGSYTVTVNATNINSDGLPGNADTTDQDFALVIYNASTGCVAPTVSGNSGTFIGCTGSPMTFSVSANGTGIGYQWRKNTSNIVGATAATYSIPSIVAGDSGSYDCVITGTCGSVTSNAATLTIGATTAVTGNPSPVTVCAGGSASFIAAGSGSNIGYQWRKGSVAIGGATSSTLTINPVSAGDAANYDCVITGDCGSATTTAAALTVNPATAITGQPTALSRCPGSSATFTVGATGTSIGYQWRKNTTPIGGATSSSLIINPVGAGDAANYDCVVTGTCGAATSNSVGLTVNAVTAITGQPAPQAVCVGGSASFTVGASGTTLGYQWRKNTTPIGGATSSTLTVSPVVVGDVAGYDCVVTGACGSVTSDAAALSLNSTTFIISGGQPATQHVCEGANASFSVNAAGTNLQYQWRKGGNPIPGATSATFTITGVTLDDPGTYYCSVTGTCGIVSSTAATLTVYEPVVIPPGGGGGQPQTQTVCEGVAGGGFTLSVDATGAISGYQWRKGGNPISGATGPVYTVNPAQPSDSGSYDCVVSGFAGICGSVTSAPATVTIVQTTAILTPPQPQTGCIGGSATFSVTAAGGGFTFQWRKGGIDIVGATSSSLTFNPIGAADAADYDCVVTGTCGSATSAAASLSLIATTTITGQPAPQTACIGGTASFTVTADGASPTYQWRKGGNPIGGATNATLSLNPVTADDAGSYDCVVTGTCGSATCMPATLTLTPQTAISGHPAPQSACTGGTASFTVTADGSTLTYQWRKDTNPIPGATDPTYTINPVASGDAGSYDCVVTGTCGSATSTAASLTVNDPLSITLQPSGQNACDGSAVSLSVAVTGTSPTYQWRKDTAAILGATGPTLTIDPASLADAGAYDCVITGTCGSVTSSPANVGVCSTVSISTQPAPQSVCPGGSATFTVSAGGSALTHQWRKDTNPISGATGPSITLTSAAQADAGIYDCVVANCCNTSTSSGARMNVCAADYNCNGSLQVQDIFDFLSAWFAGSLSADFNGGGLAVQDIFDFLSAWFAGCP